MCGAAVKANSAAIYDVLQGLDESAGEVYLEAARRMGIIPDDGEQEQAAPEPPLPEDPDAVKEERFRVEGMSCPSCSWVLQQVLLSDSGVLEADADFFTGSARVMPTREFSRALSRTPSTVARPP